MRGLWIFFASSVDLLQNVHISNFMNRFLWILFPCWLKSPGRTEKDDVVSILVDPQASLTGTASHPHSSSGFLGETFPGTPGPERTPGLSHPLPTKLHCHQVAQMLEHPLLCLLVYNSGPASHEPKILRGRAYDRPGEAWWRKGHL